MTDKEADINGLNFSLFRDCLAGRVLLLLSRPEPDAVEDDLTEFSEYLATEVWPSLPKSIRTLSHESINTSGSEPDSESIPLNTIPASFSDTLVSYSLVASEKDDPDAPYAFLRKVLDAFIPLAAAPPTLWSSTRTSECEICEREVPLTYHHLIPRSVHSKVLKRGWHKENMLNSVAWLCRPCHSVVHSVASCEVLAREYYTVERLLEREDIQKWRKYASKQRWGSTRIRRAKEREERI